MKEFPPDELLKYAEKRIETRIRFYEKEIIDDPDFLLEYPEYNVQNRDHKLRIEELKNIRGILKGGHRAFLEGN